MGKYVDITGHKYNRLLALEDVGKDVRNGRVWKCRCDCGNYVNVSSNHLRRGHSKSCGCISRESAVQRFTTHGHTKKGQSTEYKAWSNMISRCTNSNTTYYDNYGGRGISVCDRWLSFENFLSDMGLKPSPKHSIDRIDVNGNYEPSNCRWATMNQQARNTRLRKDNTTGVRGVQWAARQNCWRANFRINKKYVALGYFNTFEEAVEARKQAEIKYWGKSS